MAKTKGRAGKRASASGRNQPRARKSGAPKDPKFGSRKPKPAKSAAHKQKASLASESMRLKQRLKTARLQQQASAELLRAVADAAGDAARPLQLIAETTARLFGAASVSIQLAEGNEFTQEYRVGAIAHRIGSAYPRSNIRVGGRNLPGTVVAENRQIHIPDLDHLDPSMADFPGLPHARAGGARIVCGTPLRHEGKAIGVLIVFRDRLLPFTDDELALQQSFTDQPVIAIENARLFNETQEALERQTATADILKVIASSPSDVLPVFAAIAERSNRLIGGLSAAVYSIIDGALHLMAFTRTSPEADAALQASFPRPLSEAPWADQVRKGQIVEIADAETEWSADPRMREVVRLRGFRSLLFVPLLRDGTAIGLISVTRLEAGTFAPHHVQLLQTFADQAVIAIGNVRLFDEVQAKTHDLTEALERQTASADILKVIASSPDDVQPVFQAIAERSNRLVSGFATTVVSIVDDVVYLSAFTSTNPAADVALEAFYPQPLSAFTYSGAIRRGEIHRIVDAESELSGQSAALAMVRQRGWRSALWVPLLLEGKAIGVIGATRVEPGPFADHHVEMLKTFADQAVIAISNVKLFQQVQERTRELSQSLDELRAAQDRLVQTEKLASLGQLTAGIAHEIKNPLNFINNFAALSTELVEEMNDLLADVGLEAKKREDLDEIRALLKSNLEKVVQHGKRADSIVKNMLLHSREGSGERRSASINGLVEESLNLAYHGARAEKAGFDITLEHDLDPNAGTVDLYPQEITRALLNLISNGFYAAIKRKAETGDDAFEPVVSAATRNLGKTVEIRIRDNGGGIPPEVREKMFNPFFTTKPTGEGTGLGLSMSHDIVVKQHGGKIDFETKPGEFTEFIITLPRNYGIPRGPQQD